MLSREAAGIWPTSKKNRHLVLAESHAESVPKQCNPAILPSSLIVNLDHTPSAGIQQGGRVGLSSVPHGKLVAYKSYI